MIGYLKKLLLPILLVWTLWGNTALELNTVTVTSERLPENFDGYRIAQVSDLHNAQMGENNEALLAMLRSARPDMIAITGDMIDSKRTDIEVALDFAREAVKIAPCCYVTGNHEGMAYRYDELKEGLEAAGVTVLDNQRMEINRANSHITILGIDDPQFQNDLLFLYGDSADVVSMRLDRIQTDYDGFTVLLSHRPEFFDVYTEHDLDVVLSGHVHGGQFRLPFVGGLLAPDQSLFPEYDVGLYTNGNTNMIVSRGIGNSLIPIRFNNRPEVVLIELRSGQ